MSDLTNANSEEAFLSRLWRRVRGVSEPNLRESIEDALDETEEEGTEFSLEERHMLRNLLGFRDVRVDDVMVPRAANAPKLPISNRLCAMCCLCRPPCQRLTCCSKCRPRARIWRW